MLEKIFSYPQKVNQMKMNLAGLPGAPEQNEHKYKKYKRLYSFYELTPIKGGGRARFIMKNKDQILKNRKTKLFLDSGAYSAYMKKVTIDLDEYIQFVKENKEYFEVYANLDVPEDPETTLKNQKIMEKAGLHPLPVFHYGEDPKFLQYYIDNYDYVALGGMAGGKRGRDLQRMWLDDMFANYICDKKGFPKVKVHGFGMTSVPFMLRYPWYSVDSTAWIMVSRHGNILVPHYKDGEWLYDRKYMVVQVSNQSPSRMNKNKHIRNMPENVKRIIIEYLKMKGYTLGKSRLKKVPEDYKCKENEIKYVTPHRYKGCKLVEEILERGVCNDYKLRDELNAIYFMDMEKNSRPYPWPFILPRKKEVVGFGI